MSSYAYRFSFGKSSSLPSLTKAVPRDTRGPFLRWLQQAVNESLECGLTTSWKNFSIYLPNLDHVHADLTLAAVIPAADNQDDLGVVAVATFSNISPDTQARSQQFLSIDERQSRGAPGASL